MIYLNKSKYCKGIPLKQYSISQNILNILKNNERGSNNPQNSNTCLK